MNVHIQPQPHDDHARLMDRMYRGQRHIYDLTRKYYLFGRDTAINGLELRPGMSLLELGCGTGRNLELSGRRHPGTRLFGLDISQEMLLSAKARFEKARTPVTLVPGDAANFRATDLGEPQGFDRVMISYALSMIPDWQGTVEAGLAALKPGGSLHIVDFGRQEDLPRWFRSALRGWLARFHVTPRDTLNDYLARLADERGLTLEISSLGGGYATQAILYRHVH